MPQYRIDGADRATALDRMITIEAENEEVAAIEASNRGVVVSRIQAIDRLAEIATAADRALNQHPPSPPKTRSRKVPEYGALAACATAFKAVAILYALACALAILAIIMSNEGIAAIAYVVGAGGLIGAIILYAIGEGLAAFRDLVRNSFR